MSRIVVELVGCDPPIASGWESADDDVLLVYPCGADLVDDGSADVVVLGPAVVSPLSEIQTLAQARRPVQVIVLAPAAGVDALAQQVQATSYLHGSVRCLRDDDEPSLAAALSVAVEKERSRRTDPSGSSRGPVLPEAGLGAIVDLIATGIVALDPAGRITGLNRAAEDLLGVPSAMVIGRKIGAVLPPHLEPVVSRTLAAAGHTAVRCRCTLERSHRVRHLRATMLRRSGPGDPPGLVVALEDVTDSVALGEVHVEVDRMAGLQRALLARASAQTEFVAKVSHEIRTPLNAMVGMSQFLLDSELSADQREFVETIRLSADILVSLVNRTLELVKTESGEAAVASAPFDVRTLLEDGLRLITAQAAQKGLTVGYTIDDGVPLHLVGDAQRLRQILVNLLANAVRCTDRGGVDVSVGTRPGPGNRAEIHVAVRDTGIGIPPDRLEDIFTAFTQIGGASVPPAQGTGLGLTISRSLVTLLGGRIWAESTPGEGSAFHFTFPAVSAPAPAAPLPAEVLLVEAEASELGDAIRRWGLDPVVVDTAAEARRLMADGRRFGAVLVTNHGPGLAVRQLADELRADPATAEVPLVLLHHPNGIPTDDEAFDSVLSVPVDHAALRETLSRLLRTGTHRYGPGDGRPDGTMAARLPLRILVVEDNEVNQRVACLMLDSLGYTADLAADGWEAVDASSIHTYDVVLMDLVLPGLNGYEATAEIQRRLGTSAPKVVALTARDSDEDRTRGLEAGMDAYLAKPITVDKLAAVLTSLAEDAHQAQVT